MIGYHEIVGSQEFNMDQTEASMEDWDYSNTEEACAYLKRQSEEGDRPFSFPWAGLIPTENIQKQRRT